MPTKIEIHNLINFHNYFIDYVLRQKGVSFGLLIKNATFLEITDIYLAFSEN